MLSKVSNLLGSPASGEELTADPEDVFAQVSNLLGSPASGEVAPKQGRLVDDDRFQFIGFPSEWGVR